MNDLLDRRGLQNEFDMEPIEEEVRNISKRLQDNPVEILKENIDRANDILDLLEREMENGNLSARMAEVSGQLINSITNASKEIISGTNYSTYLQIRKKMLELKKWEIEIKEKQMKKPERKSNLIIADREAILKLMDEEN